MFVIDYNSSVFTHVITKKSIKAKYNIKYTNINTFCESAERTKCHKTVTFQGIASDLYVCRTMYEIRPMGYLEIVFIIILFILNDGWKKVGEISN